MNIRYTLAITEPAQHLLDVTIEVSEVTQPHLDFALPTWTPGSYLIREYARHVQQLSATIDDQSASTEKLDKQTWRVTVGAGAARTVRLRYRVYGNELTVRTNHVDDTHAHVIPAATFMAVVGATAQPLSLVVSAPDGWQIATGLDQDAPDSFRADDFDQLVDCPLEIGQQRVFPFEVDGVPHRLVIWGQGNEDPQRLVADTRTIVAAARDLFGGLPYQHYTFLLMLAGKSAGGGLEHRNSTSLLLPRFTFGSARSYERFLTLASHEFFHVWNVKRIRAAALGPFDYSREAYTTLLWAMEGVTEYYTDLLLVRAGLLTQRRYLERLSDDIATLQTTPGRLLQSLECASWDAWIKAYRPDENSVNTSISYYLKGAIVAALLDLELLRQSDGRFSLDDVLRYLLATYPLSGPGIPERAGYLAAIREVTGLDLSEFFARYIGGVEELPLAEVLGAFGLRLHWDWSHKAPDGTPRPSLGVRTKRDGGLLRVTNVLHDTPAYRAGVNTDDEIIALDDVRIIDEGGLRERLDDHRADDEVTLTVARREQLRTLTLTLAAPAPDKLTIERAAELDEQQRALYDRWLGQAAAVTSGQVARS